MHTESKERYFRRPSGETIVVIESSRVDDDSRLPPTWATVKGDRVSCDSEGVFHLGNEVLTEVKP